MLKNKRIFKLTALMMCFVSIFLMAAPVKAEASSEFSKVNLYFVRHGKTILNTLDRVQGWSDSPLTEQGVDVAKNTACGLSEIAFDSVYSSDRMRTVETAQIILAANKAGSSRDIIKMAGLRESNFGKFEGELNGIMWGEVFKVLGISSIDELMELEDGTAKALDTLAEIDETGEAESHEEVASRLMKAVNTIIHEAQTNGDQNVLIVGHGAAIATILGEMSGQTLIAPENASVSLVEYGNGSYQLVSVGDMSYAERGKAMRANMPAEKTSESGAETGIAEGKETGEVVVYLTRHGKTVFNTMDRVQGWVDSPLTKAGIEVAVNLGKGVSDVEFSEVYTSDMGRTIETAEIVLSNNKTGKNLNINEVPGLRETYYGKFESGFNKDMLEAAMGPLGLSSLEELFALDDMVNKVINALHELDETGKAENYEMMSTRVFTAFDGVCKKAAANGGGNILVVSHGNAIMAILDLAGGADVNEISNASVTKIIYKDGVYKVESVNDMSYAEAGARK